MKKKKKLTPKDFDRWETPPGAVYAIGDREEKPSVAKSYNEIRKFNPFHDARGRFSNKQGFKSYSANPKMRAAQPSILRAAQAGHGTTFNVHRESKGENINQNSNWLMGGASASQLAQAGLLASQGGTKKPAPAPAPAKKPAAKPKPKAPATDDTQKPKAAPKPQADQQTTTPKGLNAAVSNVTLSSGDKLAIQARNWNGQVVKTRAVAAAHDQDRVA